jgi:hypothetical protein
MQSELINSVILITSSDSSRKDFGTGFVIHQDQKATYVLTCAHVVRDVGGQENLRIYSNAVEVIALGEDDGFDLAILKVKGLLNKSKLSLSVSGKEGQSFSVAGYYKQGPATLSSEISGKLVNRKVLVSKQREAETNAWDLEIEGKHRLQPGYSGSPVVDKTSGKVLGVAIQRLGEGQTGLAISIEALEKIWSEMPPQLLRPSVEAVDNTQLQQPLGLEDEDVEQIEQPILAQAKEYQQQQEEQGVDYTKLRDLLAQGNWKELESKQVAPVSTPQPVQPSPQRSGLRNGSSIPRHRLNTKSTFVVGAVVALALAASAGALVGWQYPFLSSKPQVNLNSEVGVNYSKLQNLLAQGKWKEADGETQNVMLKVAGREKDGSGLRIEDIDKFPCTDLRTIDTLWVKYSKGRFGFSVQKRIWESVGGTPDADAETYLRFYDRIKWRENGVLLQRYDFLNFSVEKAPEGHLPASYRWEGAWLVGVGGGWWELRVSSLASRLVNCNI